MPKELLEAGSNDPANIFSQALAASSGDDLPEVVDNDENPGDDDAPAGDDVDTDDEAGDDEDVDNNDDGDEGESEDDADEFEDEDLDDEDDGDEEGEEGDEEPDENAGEPEEGSYESGYLYKPEGEDTPIFLRAVDPVTGEGSTYLNREEAEAGLGRSAAYIGDLKKQLTEGRESANGQIAALEKELVAFRAGVTSPEAARATLIASKMPERFRGVDPTTLGEDDLKAYKQAAIDAEIAASREISEEAARLETERKSAQEAEDRATSHVASRAADVKFFGFRNMEDRVEVQKKLREKPEGSEHTFQDIAISIGKAYGNEVADMFLRTLINPSPSQAEEPSTEKKPVKKTAKKTTKKATAKTTKKVAKQVKRKKKPTGGKATKTPAMPSSAREMMTLSFAQGKNSSRRR